MLRRSPLQIFTAAKAFSEPWIGQPTLNRAGLHPVRIALSDAALGLRRLQAPGFGRGDAMQQLRRNGVVVLPDFLPAAQFEALQREAREAVAESRRVHPPPPNQQRGFGDPIDFPGGFDRYDGGTLNRFLALSGQVLPHAHAFATHDRVSRLCQAAAGARHRPDKFWIHEIVHGDERDNPDIQKRLHKDTFHSTVKIWFTLEDVEPQHGPFHYVVGSHRMTRQRYAWEYRRSLQACAPDAKSRGGAFRVTPAELDAMGLPAPTPFAVRANTLLMADTRGFHRRGHASAGSRRLAIYAGLRPSPFSPVSPW
jgi:hypothetical protein